MAKATPKTKAWRSCARYCKVRGCLRDRGVPYLGICVTCGKPYHIAYLEAGHAISGRRNAVLFDIEIIDTQCSYCNQVLHGRQQRYREILAQRHGPEWMENRLRRAKRVIKDNQIDFEKLQLGFDRMYKKAMQGRGIRTWSQLLQEGRPQRRC